MLLQLVKAVVILAIIMILVIAAIELADSVINLVIIATTIEQALPFSHLPLALLGASPS